MANILVTGGAGYVGSHVCLALSEAGHTPITYDNLGRGRRAAVKWGPLEEGDLADRARLIDVLRTYKPDAVMHLAGFAYVDESIKVPLLYYANNFGGTISLLAAMQACGVSRIVASSTCAVYRPTGAPLTEDSPVEPATPYGASKLMMERAMADCARTYGLQWAALRYFNAAGADPQGRAGETTTAGVRIIPNLLDVAAGSRDGIQIFGTDYPTSDGTCVRDFIHVADIAAAHLKALEKLESLGATRIFNLGNGEGFSIRAVAETVARVTKKPIPVTVGPRRVGDAPMLMADADRAHDVLGWQPRWPGLADMIAHAWAWRQGEGAQSTP